MPWPLVSTRCHVVAVVAGVAGVAAAATHLVRCWRPLAMPGVAAASLIALVTITSVVALLVAHASDARGALSTDEPPLAATARRLWPAFLAIVPIALVPPKSWWAELIAFGAVSAFLWCSRSTPRTPASPPADVVPPKAADRARLLRDPVTLAGLSIVGLAAVVYFIAAARAPGNYDNDGAYYFAVARHIARTGRFEEPIVWTYLDPPATILHRPFDYWAGMTSVLLVPALTLFGATQKVAFVTMALVSTLTVTAFWYLVCVAAPLRFRPLRLVAIVVFAFSPAMGAFRFETDSVPVAHLWIVSALVALAIQRRLAVVVFGLLLVLTRGDGIVGCAILWIAALADAHAARARVRPLASAMLALTLGYVGYHLLVFGSPGPPSAGRAPFIDAYGDLFAYDKPHPAPLGRLVELFDPKSLSERANAAIQSVATNPFVPRQELWFGLALLPGMPALRGRQRVATVAWVMLFPGAFALTVVTHKVFWPDRTLHELVPVMVLAGAFGMDEVIGRARVWLDGARSSVTRTLLFAAVVWISTYGFVAPTRPYRHRPVMPPDGTSSTFPMEPRLAALDSILRGEPVAAIRPWFVAASTTSPTIQIPEDGERAMEAAFLKYGVRWMMLCDYHSWMRDSRPVLDKIVKGSKRAIGSLQLTEVPTATNVRLFRVEPTLERRAESAAL